MREKMCLNLSSHNLDMTKKCIIPFVSIVDALQPPLSNCPLGYADFGFV